MVTGTTDRFLKAKVAIPLAYTILEPNLLMYDLIPFVKEDDATFMYRSDATKSADAKKEKPPRFMDGADLPEIDRSRKVVVPDITQSRGFAMRFPRQLIRDQNAAEPEIKEGYETAGFWLAEALNTTMLSSMIAGATATAVTPTAVWSSTATCNPIGDLRRYQAEFDREGYSFQMTDAFVHKTNFDELNAYLWAIDVTDASRELFGKPVITSDTIHIPGLDLDVHKVKSGISEGSILGLDKRTAAAECHYYVDPKYGSADVTYQTVVNGAPVTKTVPNIGIHFNQYEEPDRHDTVMQFWYEQKTVVRRPYGLMYGTGI